MARLLYSPTLPFLREKPPVAMVEKACVTASKRGISASQSAMISTAVIEQ